MTIEEPCALSGRPASQSVIIGLAIYYFLFFFVLACWYTYLWSIIQNALYLAMAADPDHIQSIRQGVPFEGEKKVIHELMKSVVATVGTKTPLTAEVVTIKGVKVLAIPDSLAVPAVMATGAFGGLIHSIRSTYFHVIEGDFVQADAIKMFLRPFSGSILALLFFLVLRAGLGDATDKPDAGASIIFYVAVGGIVGMFTDQTVAKLKKIAEAILTKPEEIPGKQSKEDQS